MTVEAQGYGADLRLMRVHRKLTQQMVAERMGLSKSTISKIESGEQPPSLQQVTDWASACGFDVRLFYSRKEVA